MGRTLQQHSAQPDFLQHHRERVAQRFDQFDMPRLKYGLGISTHLDFDLADAETVEDHTHISVETCENAEVLQLSEALKREELKECVENRFATLVTPHNKIWAFHHLNATPLFIYLPENTDATVEFTITPTHPSSSVHVFILGEDNAHAKIIERRETTDVENKDVLVSSAATEIITGEGCNIEYAAVQDLSEEWYVFTERRSSHGKDAHVSWLDANLGGKMGKSEVYSHLDGEGSSTRNHGLFLAARNQIFDLFNGSVHNALHTDADVLAKGVQTGKTRSVYRGMIHIKEGAAHATGFQKSDTLLLSDQAKNQSIPILEINNNEVQTQHASVTSHIDENELFYVQSRGLDEESAKKLIVEGFYHPVLQHATPKLQKLLYNRIRGKLDL